MTPKDNILREEFEKKCKHPQCLTTMSLNSPDYCPDHNSENKSNDLDDEFPMGMSAWKSHGVKFGYWDFFLSKIHSARKEAQMEVLERVERKLPEKVLDKKLHEKSFDKETVIVQLQAEGWNLYEKEIRAIIQSEKAVIKN